MIVGELLVNLLVYGRCLIDGSCGFEGWVIEEFILGELFDVGEI